MASLRKKPVFLSLLFCLVAVSSFALSYSLLANQDGAASGAYAVLGGSCCSVDTATVASTDASACALAASAPTCSLDGAALTVAANKETAGTEPLDACCALEQGTVETSTANTDNVTQTQVASVE